MNLKIFSGKLSSVCVTMAIAMMFSLTSCMPDGGDDNNGGNNGGEEENKPLPESVKQISLFSGYGGGSLAGLYFSEDGFITSSNGWLLSSLGAVHNITNVNYIPCNDWFPQITPTIGLGFVGYHPNEGFVGFLVAGLANSDMYTTVGVGLMYYPAFPTDYAFELQESSVDFLAGGATHTVKMDGTKYCEYEIYVGCDWLTATPKASSAPFILDEIELTAKPNTMADPRSVDVVIRTQSGKTTTLKVSQRGASVPE